MAYLPIEDYGLIGNMHTAALVGLLLGGTLAVGPLWIAAALLLRAPRHGLIRPTGDGVEVF